MNRQYIVAAGMLTAVVLGSVATPVHAAGLSGCTPHHLQNGSKDANGGTYYVCSLDTKQYPKALCNDGTAGTFQVLPAADGNAARWVVWLEGGYACYDSAGCATRAQKTPKLVSATGWGPVRGQALLLHDPNTNPALAGANTVLVHYCSSDAWSGEFRARDQSGFNIEDTNSWNFEGRAIVQSVIQTLVDPSAGFGMSAATQVVLGGSSAGANGITYLANDLLPLLPSAAQILLVQDAGFTIDVDAYDPSKPPHYEATGGTTPNDALFNEGRLLWHGHGDTGCAAQAQTVQQRIECYDTSILLQEGYVTLPAFVAEPLLDEPEVTFQICPQSLGDCSAPTNPDTKPGIYATYYSRQSAALLSENGAAQLPYTTFSPDIYVHTVLNLDTQFTTALLQPQNLSARDVFDSWYANPTGPGTAYLGTSPGVAKPVKYRP
jgi:hypothetical protein